MAKVGRNAPCPCGSGKKYKHCCLRREHADQHQRITVQRLDQELIDQVLEFATAEGFYVDSSSAAQLYWDTKYAPRLVHLLPPYERLLFLEWYVFDYRTSRERKRCSELFLQKNGEQLRSDQAERLLAFLDSRLGLYQVEEVTAGKLWLRDLLREESALINGEQWVTIVEPDDVIIGRLLGIPEFPYMSPRAILLPPEAAAGLQAYAESQFEGYREDHVEGTVEGFLLDSGYRLAQYLRSQDTAGWHDKVGADTAYYDARSIHQLLGSLEEQMREEELKALEEKRREEALEEEEEEPRGEILTPDQVRQSMRSQKREPERQLPTTPSGLVLPSSMRPEEPQEETEEQVEEAEEEKEGPVLYIPGRGY